MSNLRRKISLILLISLILSTIFTPIKVEAATPYKLINLWEKKVTVGGVKFSSKTDADTGKVTIYYKTNNKSHTILHIVCLSNDECINIDKYYLLPLKYTSNTRTIY